MKQQQKHVTGDEMWLIWPVVVVVVGVVGVVVATWRGGRTNELGWAGVGRSRDARTGAMRWII